jgi:hypothetical protein
MDERRVIQEEAKKVHQRGEVKANNDYGQKDQEREREGYCEENLISRCEWAIAGDFVITVVAKHVHGHG